MRRAVGLVCGIGLLTASLTPLVAGAKSPPNRNDPCNRTSWVAGTVDLCDGMLIYRDYVYDDYGAHHPVNYRTAPTTGPLTRPYGADRYPAGFESTADIVDLSLRIVGNELEAVFELNALNHPEQTDVVLLIDTDNNPATQASPRTPFPGPYETVWRGHEVHKVAWRGEDLAANTITMRLPLPSGEVWRIGAFAAQRRDQRIMNVAFRGRETSTLTTGAWFDDRQATALRNGDISEFAHVVRVDELHRRVTRAAEPVKGFHERVYVSGYTLPPGEGMSYTPQYGRHGNSGAVCEQAFHYFGRYQPYAIYVPDKPAPHGVQLTLHGCSAGMTSVINGDGMQANVGEARNRILVSPLGRGPYGYYSDISERDVLDVVADVLRSHSVDTDRVFSGGYSMGGYGAYRLAALYPDVFAGAIAWVGFTGDAYNNPVGPSPSSEPSGAIGNVIDFVRNLRHIPTAMLYSGADELVHTPSAVAMQQRFQAEQGGAYEWFFHPTAEHFTYGVTDDWRKESDWTAHLSRVARPARVVFRTDEALAYPEYGLRHDRAYWVSGVDARGDGYADVDLATLACGGSLPTYTEGRRQGSDPVPWHSENRLPTGSEPIARRDAIEGTLTNVASVVVDTSETCLAGRTVGYKVTTDGPATLRLSDGRQASFAAAGTHDGVIPAAGKAGIADGGLPATGVGFALAALALLGTAATLRCRR